jgi:hypothetical protein
MSAPDLLENIGKYWKRLPATGNEATDSVAFLLWGSW